MTDTPTHAAPADSRGERENAARARTAVSARCGRLPQMVYRKLKNGTHAVGFTYEGRFLAYACPSTREKQRRW
jgi:hypothetical protein